MNHHGTLTTWVRLVLAAMLAAALGIVIGAGSPAGVAQAALVAPETRFVIDGDRTGPNDFAAPYGPGTTPAGFQTTGLYYDVKTVDQGGASGCNLAADDTGLGGLKLGDGPVWPTGGPNPNGKTDLDFIDLAAEKVSVPTGSGFQIADILYVGYQKCGGTGTWQTSLYLDDGDGVVPSAGDNDGDFLFIFDFNPSSGAVTFFQYNRVAGAWQEQTTNTAYINGKASADYGEVALNLTGLDVFGAGSSRCSSIVVSGPAAAITGGDLSSQVKDLLAFQPLTISNCGAIDISKLAADGNATSSSAFHYTLNQIDANPVHDATLTAQFGEPDANRAEIDADIHLGDTHSWVHVISQPDYRLVENLPLPAGWVLDHIQCTYTNIFGVPVNGVYPTVTTTGAQFLIPPASMGNVALPAASCQIVNDAIGVTIVKTGTGTPSTFNFDVSGAATGVPVVLNGPSVFQPVPTTGSYTITEAAKAATPAWTLTSISCVNGQGSPTGTPNLAGRSVTIAINSAADDIVCTFNNAQAAKIVVNKTGAPAGGSFGFDHDVVDGNTDGAADNSIPIGGSFNTGDITPGTYHINELLAIANAGPAPDYVGSGSCSVTQAGSNTSSSSLVGVNATVTVGAGDIVTCTFNNVQNGRIIVDKTSVDGDATFNFTGAVSGAITTVAGATPAGQALSADKVPGTYSVAESATPGYTLTSSSCVDPTANSTPASIGLAAGETVTCSFVNTRNKATLTLKKVWGSGSPSGDTINLDATLSGPAPVTGAIHTTSTSPVTTTQTLTVYSLQTVNLSETFAGATGDAYTTSLSCVGGGTLTPGALNRTGSLVVGNNPTDVTCTFTNTPKTAGVLLQKVWAANAKAGDQASLSMSTSPSAHSDSATSTAPAAPVYGGPADAGDNTAFVAVNNGDVVTFSENLGAAAVNYTTTFACTGATNAPVKGADNYHYTLTIATADVASSAEIHCAFTNTRIQVALRLAKNWDDAIVGNAATITATGSDTSPITFVSTAGAADETDTSGVFTVYAGETLTLGETINPGDPLAYTSSLSCTGAADANPDNGLAIGAADTSITCTYTNVRRPVKVVVAKSLSPVTDNGSFDLSVNGVERVANAVNGSSNAATPVTVLVGDTVTLAELADASSPALANYTSSLACNNGVTVAGNTGTSGSFVVPSALASNTVVTCTFTNTRKQAPLTVTKSWGSSPVDNEQVDLTISGGLATPVAGTNTNDGDDANDVDATATVYAGETIHVAEAFVSGVAGNYNTSLVCTDASGSLLSSVDLLAGQLSIPSSPTAISCTFTNDRKTATVHLQKRWINARAADTAGLTISGISPSSPATATSTVAGLPTFTDVANVATLTAYAGETVGLGESLNAPALYNSHLVCPGQPNTAGTLGALAIGAADEGADLTCTFVNTRRQLTLELDKSWANSPVNGDTVGLSLGGGLIPPTVGSVLDPALDSNDGDGTNDEVATMTALFGETISLAESFTVGDPVNYDTALVCGDFSAPVFTYTDGALAGTLFVDAADLSIAGAENEIVTCTFTNTRKSTTLTLHKAWVAPHAGDKVALSIDGEYTNDDTSGDVVAPAVTETASATVYAGETVAISETIDAANVAIYDVTDVTCSAGGLTWNGGIADTSATLAVSAADTAGAIDCTIENSAERGTIKIVKAIAGESGTFDFTGTWTGGSTFELTPPADGSDMATFEGVLVPKNGSPYIVTETDPGANYGTVVQCADGDPQGASASTPGAPAAGRVGSIGLDNGETVICTFNNTQNGIVIIEKIAQPALAQDFGFTTDLPGGNFQLDDDASNPALLDTITIINVVPGSYSVTETAVPGWDLTNLVCSDANSATPSTTDAASATIHVDPAETVTCTFTNTAQPGQVSITKTVSNVAADYAWSFDFTIDPAAAPTATQTASGVGNAVSDPITWTNLVPGQSYTITETVPAGWTQLAIACAIVHADPAVPADEIGLASFTVEPGDVISCNFDNAAISPTLVVEKATIGAVGTFTFDIAGGTATPASVSATTTSDSGVFALSGTSTLLAGDGYTVTEQPVAGWSAGVLSCTVTHADATSEAYVGGTATRPGDSIVCMITNTKRGQITVTKVASPAAVTATANPFEYTVTYTVTVKNESFVDETFSLSDTPDMAANVLISSMLVNGPGVVALELGADGGEIVVDGTIAARAGQGGADDPAALVYTVVVTFTMAPSNTAQDCIGQGGNGAFNTATVTFQVPPTTDSSSACVDLPKPAITVTKVADAPVATQVAGFQYRAVYTVTVTNNGDGPGSYSVADLPDFASGDVDSVTIAPVPALANVIAAGDSDVYTVTVLFTVAGDLDLGLRTCGQEPTPGQGGYNGVTVSYGIAPDPTSAACVEIPSPAIDVTKVATTDVATPVAATPNTYQAVYTVTVRNTGDGPGSYSVADLPDLGTGADVVSTAIVPVPAAATPIEAGGSDVYTVTVTFTVDGAMALSERICSGDPGDGAYNGVTVTYNGEQTATSDDCVEIPAPKVTITKTTSPEATRNADGTWTVVYTLTVANTGTAVEAGPGQYTLTDSIDFGSNVTVNTIAVVPAAAGFTGVAPNNVIVTDQLIGHNATHVYTVTANVSINPVNAAGSCANEGGLFNAASVQLATQEASLDANACASYSTLTLVKQAPNDNGANLPASAFTLTAKQGDATIISGSTPAMSAVSAGSYVLDESPRLAGYTITGYTCTGGSIEGATVTVPLGANVVCTIVNDDKPVDLRLTKDDGGFQAIAGGAPIPYTITVQNVGTRNVDSGEPVTMTDTLPASYLSWVLPVPAGCSVAGLTLTCTIAAGLLEVGDAPVVFALQVRVAADAPSGSIVNLASVTTQDDPACVGEGCVPVCPTAGSANNNVDCEQTPVNRQGAIQIVKTDDVADGVVVEPGDVYGYTLVVTNTGTSTILPGLVVTDDLPAQLGFVSATGGAGWSCNTSDPIECTYAPALAPGEIAPPILVKVSVAAAATGTAIDNTAVVVGAIDRDCLTPASLAEAFTPACNQVTDDDSETTPLNAAVDLQIVKSASVAVVGAGGGFDWILDIANNGPGQAKGVVVGDIVPSQLVVTGVTSAQFSCSNAGNTVTCTKPTMAVGEVGRVTIKVTVPANAAGGTVKNIGTVQGTSPETNLGNNSDDADVQIVAQEAPTTTVVPEIPKTGSNSTIGLTQVAMLLVLLGGGAVLITRRRRDEQAAD